MPFEIQIPSTPLDEDGNLFVDLALIQEMAYVHGTLGSENKRIGKKGAGKWSFRIGNLNDPASIPAGHGFRHFAQLMKDPAFAANVVKAGISKKAAAKGESEGEEGDFGSHRIEMRPVLDANRKPTGENRPVKVRDILHNNLVTHDHHEALGQVLDTWADHMEKHGGDAGTAKQLRWEAAATRHSFGSATDADKATLAGGQVRMGGGTSKAGQFGDLSAFQGEAPAAPPAAPTTPPKGKGKKGGGAAPAKPEAFEAKGISVDAKAAWRMVESRKAAGKAVVTEAVKPVVTAAAGAAAAAKAITEVAQPASVEAAKA